MKMIQSCFNMKLWWKVATVFFMMSPVRLIRFSKVFIDLRQSNNFGPRWKSMFSYCEISFLKHFYLFSFSDSDKLGIHFHHFAKNEVYRSMPEGIKKGVPLFYLPPNNNTPELHFTNDAHMKFSQYWKPICMLDVNMCQKSSLHTLQINILLRHDTPLPEFLYQPNTSGRYDNIQCNQAMSVLSVMLKEWCSFVLLENHSYIKLIELVDFNLLVLSKSKIIIFVPF